MKTTLKEIRKIIKEEVSNSLNEKIDNDQDLYDAYENLKISLMGGAPGIYGDELVEKAFEKEFKKEFKISFDRLCKKFTEFSYMFNDIDFN